MKLVYILSITIALSGCATTRDSVLLGAGIGAGTGALSGGLIGAGSDHDVRGALIGTAVGAASGALIGLLINNGNKKNSSTVSSTNSTAADLSGDPFLTKPEVRKVWVDDKVEDNQLIKGHYIYVIEKNSQWSTK